MDKDHQGNDKEFVFMLKICMSFWLCIVVWAKFDIGEEFCLYCMVALHTKVLAGMSFGLPVFVPV